MNARMQRWSTLFRVLGTIFVLIGVIGFVLSLGDSKGIAGGLTILLGCLPGGLVFFFITAVLEWMDGVLDHLSGIHARLDQLSVATQQAQTPVRPERSGAQVAENRQEDAQEEAGKFGNYRGGE